MTGSDSNPEWAAPAGSNSGSDTPGAPPEEGHASGPQPEHENQWGSAAQWSAPQSPQGQSGRWHAQQPPQQFPGQYHQFGSYRPGVIPLRALGLSEILDGAFKAIRHNPRVIFGVTLPAAIIASLLQVAITVRMFELLDYEYLTQIEDDIDGVFAVFDDSTLILGGLSVALNLLFIPLITGILTISVSRSTMGKKLSLAQTWAMLRGRKSALVGSSLLTSLIIIAPLAALFALLPLLDSAGIILTALPLLFFAVAATIFFTTRLLFVPQVVVLERQSVRMAFKRGWLLTRGSFWRILGIYLLATLIASVVSSIISTPLSFVAIALGTISNLLGASIFATSTIVTLLITIPYSAAIAAIIYIDIRMRREGLDIELARAAESTA